MQTMLWNIMKTPVAELNYDTSFGGSLLRLQLVAKHSLVEKILESQFNFAEVILEISYKKMPIDTLNNNARNALDIHSKHLLRYSELTAMISTASPNALKLINDEQEDIMQKVAACTNYHDSALTLIS